MAKSKIKLIKTHCELCNKEIYTANQSLYGLDQLKSKFGIKCENCVTENKKMELLDVMGTKIAEKLSNL
jgi:Protein of unknown function (DUF2688)